MEEAPLEAEAIEEQDNMNDEPEPGPATETPEIDASALRIRFELDRDAIPANVAASTHAAARVAIAKESPSTPSRRMNLGDLPEELSLPRLAQSRRLHHGAPKAA